LNIKKKNKNFNIIYYTKLVDYKYNNGKRLAINKGKKFWVFSKTNWVIPVIWYGNKKCRPMVFKII